MDAFSLVSFHLPAPLSGFGENALADRMGIINKPPVEVKKPQEASDEVKIFLDEIFPAREFEEDGQNWVQQVSHTAANRCYTLILKLRISSISRINVSFKHFGC